MTSRSELARQAKAIVALVFRNGPIENLHAGEPCPTCHDNPAYCRISDAEMKLILKTMVNRVYSLLWLKENKSEGYEAFVKIGELFASSWDEPTLTTEF